MKKIIRTVLIDDEEFCRRDLAELLLQTRETEIVGEADNLKEAIQVIERTAPDLVFLDLNLKNADGFKVLTEITHQPAVIAVTAFPQHAVKGFSMELADYILKPVEQPRLKEGLRRACDQILLRSLRENPVLALEINGQKKPVSIADIFWVKASENYVEICTTLGRGLVRSTFTGFQRKLPVGFTLEITRGMMIARHQIKSWQRQTKRGLEITLKCGSTFQVSKRQQKEVLEQIELIR